LELFVAGGRALRVDQILPTGDSAVIRPVAVDGDLPGDPALRQVTAD
jgi:hypothetical protein